MSSYRNLLVWQKAMQLVIAVYKLICLLPQEERFGLADQMRRSAVSIPSNIAEGQARNAQRDFVRFLYIAQGSKAELETQLEICVQLGYLTAGQVIPVFQLCDEIGKMCRALILKTERK